MGPSYFNKLKDPRWQKRRLQVLQRDDFRCRLCADEHSTLHVHHLFYERGAEPWDAEDAALLTLCESCHEGLHQEQLAGRLLQALIAAGARWHSIQTLIEALDLSYPWPHTVPADAWPEVIDQISVVLRNAAVSLDKPESQVIS